MLGAILGAATGLGSLFGGAGRGAAAERQSQNDFIQRENQMRLSQQQAQQQALMQLLGLDERATMDRAQLGIAAPSARTKQAVIGSLLSRLQPASVQAPAGVRVGQIRGGLGDAIGGGAMRQAGNALSSQALQALLSRSDVPAVTNYAKTGLVAPAQMQGYKKAGKGESIMSAIGVGGGLASILGPLLAKKSGGGGSSSGGVNLGIGAF